MNHREYPAIIFRQRVKAPIQVAFVAPSHDIDAWAQVPTKKTGNVRNFQRPVMDAHKNEVGRFFADESNSSPTAVVVGFDPARSASRVQVLDEARIEVDMASIKDGDVKIGTIRVSFEDEPDLSTRAEHVNWLQSHAITLRSFVLQELQDIVKQTIQLNELDFDRLVSQMVEHIAAADGTLLSDEPSGEFDGDTDDEDSGEDDMRSLAFIRDALPGLSPSELQVVSSRLTFVARFSQRSIEATSDADLATLCEQAFDELKPGLLIDGQHRIGGTKLLPAVPFLVTALPNAPWSELAFQFIVTNRTAKKVPESLLINIVGNSLSKFQRNEIEERLRRASIRVGLIEAVMRIHEDESSPFYGMLSFGLRGETGFIDAAAMRGKVVKLWYERKEPVEELFDHFCEGRRRQDKTEHWKNEETWYDLFVAFWSAVRERYEGTAVFSVETRQNGSRKEAVSRLLQATTLGIFQGAILEHLRDHVRSRHQGENVPFAQSLPSPQKVRDLVFNFLRPLTPDFFEGWSLTGFDGSRGARSDLKEAILLVITGKQTPAKLKEKHKTHRLFKAK